MRESSTVTFHQAKRLADSLRPATAEDVVDADAQRETSATERLRLR